MFDIQMEFGVLQSRLQDVLALECLDGEELANAYVDYGYINCILEYKIMPESTTFESLEESIIAYEKVSALC